MTNDRESHGTVREPRPARSVVVAGTVTYGDRGELCGQVVAGALAAGADLVVIVDNGASHSARQTLEKLAANDLRIALLSPAVNRGSAEGFADAIAACAALGEFTWLLDDDNMPRVDALEALRSAAAELEDSNAAVLFSRRLTDQHHQRILASGDAYPPAGSFLYFDLLQRVTQGRRQRERPARRFGELVSIPYGPYGGLFGRSSVLQSIAAPKASMSLYEDDTDYTLRLADSGVSLYLCPNSVIDDLDGKWSEVKGVRGPARFLLSNDADRMMLAVRNRAYVDWRRGGTNRPRYLFNRSAFLSIAFLQSLRHRAHTTMSRVISAVREGERLARSESET